MQSALSTTGKVVAARSSACPVLPRYAKPAPGSDPLAVPAEHPPCPAAAARLLALASSSSHLAGPAPPGLRTPRNEPFEPWTWVWRLALGATIATPNLGQSASGLQCRGRRATPRLSRGEGRARRRGAPPPGPGVGCARPRVCQVLLGAGPGARRAPRRGGPGKGVGPGPPPRPRAQPSHCRPGLATWQPAPGGLAAHFPRSSGHGGTMKKSYTGGRRARGGQGSVSRDEPFLPEPR